VFFFFVSFCCGPCFFLTVEIFFFFFFFLVFFHVVKPECLRLVMPDAKDKRVYVFNAHTAENCRAWLTALQAWHNVAVPLTKEFCAALAANQLRLAYALLDKGSRASSNDGLLSSLTVRPSDSAAQADTSSARDDADDSTTVDVNAPLPTTSPAPMGLVDAVISAPQPPTAEQLERASENRQLALARLSIVVPQGASPANGALPSIGVASSAIANAAAAGSGDEGTLARVWLPKEKRTVSSKEWRTTHPALNPSVAQWESEPFAAIHFQMCPMSLRHLLHDTGAKKGVSSVSSSDSSTNATRRAVDRRRVVSTPTFGNQSAGGSVDDSEDVQRLHEQLRHERSIVDALHRMKVAFKSYDGATVSATESVLFAATTRIHELEANLAALESSEATSTSLREERQEKPYADDNVVAAAIAELPSSQPVAQPVPVAPRPASERPALPPKPFVELGD
jgi:hypothetical protein